jgi:calreticulin
LDHFIHFLCAFSTLAGWEDRWVASKAKGDLGKFTWSAGKYFNDAEADKGIKTSQDARFYGLTAKFDKFSNQGKTLVIQVCRGC